LGSVGQSQDGLDERHTFCDLDGVYQGASVYIWTRAPPTVAIPMEQCMPIVSPEVAPSPFADSRVGGSLCAGLLSSYERFPDRPALSTEGQTVRYDEFYRQAASVAATLQAHLGSVDQPPVGVYGDHSESAFFAVMGALMCGGTYVPLNPSFPGAYVAQLIAKTDCPALVVDAATELKLDEVLALVTKPLCILLPDRSSATAWIQRWPGHRFVARDGFLPADAWKPQPVDAQSVAVILFTSGSTGLPKGVVLSHANIAVWAQIEQQRYEISEQDRLSHMFPLAFDCSMFDMFVGWFSGACLCYPRDGRTLNPAQYVSSGRLTIWYSTPSAATYMRQMKLLEPGTYPGLRLSLFAGEALPAELVRAWAAAAPNSVIENVYGPAEATVTCTAYRWDPRSSMEECEQGIVPIGGPNPSCSLLVVDEQLLEVGEGEVGELLVAGPQLTLGYWKDPEKTERAFVQPPGYRETYYRTGDSVRRPIGDAPVTFLGRRDHQIKIHGARVELGEIEAVLREVAGIDTAVAIGWPRNESGAEGVVAFLSPSAAAVAEIRQACRSRLPAHMVPRSIHFLDVFPLNANGKIDRRELLAGLERGRERG
jgi:amino acid adenylation domain-containing protein